MRSIYFWAFLLGITVLPAAFFGAGMGGVLGYESERHTARATHGQVPESHLVLRGFEILGGLLFGMPGVVGVGWFYCKQKRESEKQVSVMREIRDETVWPPPPSE